MILTLLYQSCVGLYTSFPALFIGINIFTTTGIESSKVTQTIIASASPSSDLVPIDRSLIRTDFANFRYKL